VDDDPEEVRRFRRFLASRFVVGAGTSLPAALADLRAQGRERPDVFALDLYFPEGEPNTDDERAELARAWVRFLEAKAELTAVLERLRQSPEGGLALAGRIAADFPGVPVTFFTRKGTLEDAIAALEAGVAAIVKKPDPDDHERAGWSTADACDAAFARELPKVVQGLERALATRPRPAALATHVVRGDADPPDG
jgi:CheY-like chemotaxis protein